MKKRLTIYPFVEEAIPLLRNKDKINEFEIVHCIMPNDWTIDTDDEEVLKKLCPVSEFYSQDYINETDVLLICKPKQDVEFSFYSDIINHVRENRKQLMYVKELSQIIKNVVIADDVFLNQTDESIAFTSSELSDITVPVIMVLGLGENCDKFNIQLGLWDYFIKSGYKASLISSNVIAKIMNADLIPSFIDSPELTFSQQVLHVNKYVKSVQEKSNPNVIVMGVPGGVIKYNQAIPNGYGYTQFVIGNAIKPDVSILSLYCGEYKLEYIKEMQQVCHYRFGINVGYFHISNKALDYDIETKKLNYFTVDMSYHIENVVKPQEHIPAFNIYDNKSSEMVFSSIMEELQTNVSAI